MSLSWLLWWRPPCLLRTVVVVLVSNDDTAIRGVLWRTRGPWLVIRDGYFKHGPNDPEKMDGEVVIHRTNVAYVQVL